MGQDLRHRWLRTKRHLRSVTTSARARRDARRAVPSPSWHYLCRRSLPCRLAA
jgi:hypothetical protein